MTSLCVSRWWLFFFFFFHHGHDDENVALSYSCSCFISILSVCRFDKGNIIMPKIRTLFCLLDIKRRSFLTSCVSCWFVFLNAGSHFCFRYFILTSWLQFVVRLVLHVPCHYRSAQIFIFVSPHALVSYLLYFLHLLSRTPFRVLYLFVCVSLW